MTPIQSAYRNGKQAMRLGADQDVVPSCYMFEAADAWRAGFADAIADQAEQLAMDNPPRSFEGE